MRTSCFRLVHLEHILMTDLSCKCFCPPTSCFSRSSHCIHPPPVSKLADGQPDPPNQSRVPDAVEPPRAVGDGVAVLVEEKRYAPTETGETRGRELFDGENGRRDMDGSDGENGRRDMDGIDGEDELQVRIPLKSSLKRPSGAEDGRKGRVKWMDILGKDLVEVQEFESSDSEDQIGDHSIIHSCGCVIL